MTNKRAATFFQTAFSATLGAAAFFAWSANAAAQVVYSSPQFDGGFVPNATSFGAPVVVGDSFPNGAFLPPNDSGFAVSPDFSGAVSVGTPLGGQIIGEIPFNGDINSIPLLEQKQPNAPRPLPQLNVPRTDADFEKRAEALARRFSKPPLSIESSTPGRLLRYSLIGGADATFLAPNRALSAENAQTGQNIPNATPDLEPIYALGALCWNVPCGGKRILRVVDGRPLAKVGFGFQSKRGELLAALAFAKIDRNYEIRINDEKFRVQDLVDAEKLACSKGANLSTVAVGLAHYSQNPDETWTNAFGETWSLAKILEQETRRPVDWGSTEATDKLLALTFLLARLKQGALRDSPELKRAEATLIALKGRVWALFNDAPLAETLFFDEKVKLTTPHMRLYVNGALLRWLTLTASPEELRSEKTRRAVFELCALVDQLFNSVDDLDKLAPLDEESLAVAMQALLLYRARVKNAAVSPN
ncbi:MAG: hypothetical protein IJO06_00365 [Thermoguttaceae bacterium]|nr:hypothetical protein [Thermoguttaceae bacterium]